MFRVSNNLYDRRTALCQMLECIACTLVDILQHSVMNDTGVGHATEERAITCRAVRPYGGVHDIVFPSGPASTPCTQ